MDDSADTDQPEVVLVTSSRACREMLAAGGLAFRVAEPDLDTPDDHPNCLGPVPHAEAMAYYHARRAAEEHPGACVVATYTLVVHAGRRFGKPLGPIEAGQMLAALGGTRHMVVTGVAMVCGGQRMLASQVSRVTLGRIPLGLTARHLASGDWLGVAGAYAAPAVVARCVRAVEGSAANILGAPIDLIDRMLAAAGLSADLAAVAA